MDKIKAANEVGGGASMNKGLTSSLKTIFPNIVGIERPIISNQVINSPL